MLGGRMMKERDGKLGEGVQQESAGQSTGQAGAARGAQIAPVLRPAGRKSTLSDGYVLLSGSATIDLQSSERFRILRTRIERLALSGQRQQVIAVSSAIPEEGKSVVAVNLARAFGMDPQGKALIIDCDLRKPNVHRFFDEMQSPGLSDVLVAGKPLRNVIRSVEPGLDLLTAGSPVVDSTRTIQQPGLAMLIDELRKHYRHIILDCPPVLLCSEPMTLSNLADSSLLVVRSWRTQKKLVKEAVNVIGKDSLLGVVMNECTDTLQQYGYYSYYGYDKEAVVKARLRKQQGLARAKAPSTKRSLISRLLPRRAAKQEQTPLNLTANPQQAWTQPRKK